MKHYIQPAGRAARSGSLLYREKRQNPPPGARPTKSFQPYVSEEEAAQLLDMAVAIIMHANRVGQTNRSLLEARGLLSLLHRAAPGPAAASEAKPDET